METNQTTPAVPIPKLGELTPATIKALRQRFGLSQESLANAIMYSDSLIQLIETGKRRICKRTEAAILAHFRNLERIEGEKIKAAGRRIIPCATYSMEVNQ